MLLEKSLSLDDSSFIMSDYTRKHKVIGYNSEKTELLVNVYL